MTESFVGTDYKYDFIESGKVCCESEVNRISEMECVRNADIVCGVGGGAHGYCKNHRKLNLTKRWL